ncbi:hypothetical protein FKM82_031271 [Ascaphus truei]
MVTPAVRRRAEGKWVLSLALVRAPSGGMSGGGPVTSQSWFVLIGRTAHVTSTAFTKKLKKSATPPHACGSVGSPC